MVITKTKGIRSRISRVWWNRLILAVKIVIATGLILFLFTSGRLNFALIIDSYKYPIYLSSGALCCTLAMVTPIFRWWILARVQKLPLRAFDALRLTMIGYFFNMFIPGGAGGDVVRAAYAVRDCQERRAHALTIFQFYLNNKVYRRKNYNKSSAPWVFDEPMNTQDFWALRWYGILWYSAVDPVKGNTKMWYRGDISYSQFERDMFRGVMDIEYIGGNNAQKTRMKHDEQVLWGKSYFSEYGTANPIETSNIQPTAWCLSAWSKDAMGVLPWQTIGNESSWKIADQTSLFYPHAEGPKPSVRLKAFTRGQQDVEYLTIFCDVYKKPRYAVTGWLNQVIDLKGNVYRSSLKDAGTAEFDILDTMDLWELRYRVGKMISEKGPEYKRALIDWETPVFDMKNLPDIEYVPVSPQVQSYKPDCDDFGH